MLKVKIFSLLVLVQGIFAQNILEGDRSIPIEAKNAMVVTSHFLATK